MPSSTQQDLQEIWPEQVQVVEVVWHYSGLGCWPVVDRVQHERWPLGYFQQKRGVLIAERRWVADRELHPGREWQAARWSLWRLQVVVAKGDELVHFLASQWGGQVRLKASADWTAYEVPGMGHLFLPGMEQQVRVQRSLPEKASLWHSRSEVMEGDELNYDVLSQQYFVMLVTDRMNQPQ
jgi:hypothetical protein